MTRDMEKAILWLRSIGKCASLSQNGRLCTITANHQGRNHKAQQMGGPEDGKIYEEWPW